MALVWAWLAVAFALLVTLVATHGALGVLVAFLLVFGALMVYVVDWPGRPW